MQCFAPGQFEATATNAHSCHQLSPAPLSWQREWEFPGRKGVDSNPFPCPYSPQICTSKIVGVDLRRSIRVTTVAFLHQGQNPTCCMNLSSCVIWHLILASRGVGCSEKQLRGVASRAIHGSDSKGEGPCHTGTRAPGALSAHHHPVGTSLGSRGLPGLRELKFHYLKEVSQLLLTYMI